MAEARPLMIVRNAMVLMLNGDKIRADVWARGSNYYFWLNGQVHTVQHGTSVMWVETGCVNLFAN